MGFVGWSTPNLGRSGNPPLGKPGGPFVLEKLLHLGLVGQVKRLAVLC